jgi:hypothetical protein
MQRYGGELRRIVGILLGNLRERERLIGRPNLRRENNMKLDLQEEEYAVMD